MLKVRITFVDTKDGQKELEKGIKTLKDKFEVINQSKIYRGRGESKYSNVYLDIEVKGE